MSYTGSLTGVGLGSILSINTGTHSTPVWTPVGEVSKMVLSGRQAQTDDTSNFQSLAREFLATLITSGTWEVAGNRVGNDAGQLAMESNFTALTNQDFKLVLRKTAGQTTTGDSFTFLALVEEVDYQVEFDKKQGFTAKLKVSGILTLTAGS